MIEELQNHHEKKGPLWEYCQAQQNFMIIPFEKEYIHIHLLRQFIMIIQHQLPNMAQKDLFQAIFSPNSQNCLLCDHNHVLGGICFKKINYQKAVQILFFVVPQKHQRKGNGSFLMNNFKNYLIRRSINVIGTYADNNAIGFYEKHAFAQTQHINNKHFQGNIIYKNSTLMQTTLRKNINYLLLANCLKNQRLFIQNKLNEQAINSHKHKQRYLWSLNKSYIQMQRIVGINQKITIMDPQKVYINQLKQSTIIFPSKKNLNHSLNIYISRLQALLVPQLIKINPQYQKIDILQYRLPISLQNLKQKVKAGLYLNVRQFKSDLEHLIENCLNFYKMKAHVVLNLYQIKDFLGDIN